MYSRKVFLNSFFVVVEVPVKHVLALAQIESQPPSLVMVVATSSAAPLLIAAEARLASLGARPDSGPGEELGVSPPTEARSEGGLLGSLLSTIRRVRLPTLTRANPLLGIEDAANACPTGLMIQSRTHSWQGEFQRYPSCHVTGKLMTGWTGLRPLTHSRPTWLW